ncbi:MAG: imelysin family protein [Planctomycetota bacterium]
MNLVRAALAAVVLPALLAQEPAAPSATVLPVSVVARHAEHCCQLYAACERGGEALLAAVEAFLLAPDEAHLQAARDAWCKARLVYGETEALRFQGGPIEPLEPLLNAWPVDEAYIDHVVGRPDAGIVHDLARFPVLDAGLLEVANERGSEANVSVGWHAIEFLLWGQDLDAHGPGRRPASDFASSGGVPAERRRLYLRLVTQRLVEHLRTLHRAWLPDAPWRRAFVADPDRAVLAMLTGAAILSAFELCGERLAVAYETQDQEQEHSCFSDTTWHDLQANQRGITAVLAGGPGTPTDAPTLLRLLQQRDAAAAEHLAATLAKTTAALAAIPAPFDQAFLGADDAPGRRAIHAAMRALEEQAEAIAIAGKLFGHDLPMRPGH